MDRLAEIANEIANPAVAFALISIFFSAVVCVLVFKKR